MDGLLYLLQSYILHIICSFCMFFTFTRFSLSLTTPMYHPYLVQRKSHPNLGAAQSLRLSLTMFCNMDSVSRALMLRNYIDMIQSLDALSRNKCLWLFAFCVAVGTPLQAETCASLRSLLRKCAVILSTKSEMDDEAVMVNILMAICGRYFGRYEHRYE
jgi:hypothetical protein